MKVNSSKRLLIIIDNNSYYKINGITKFDSCDKKQQKLGWRLIVTKKIVADLQYFIL